MQQYSRRSNGVRKTHRKSRNGCLQCKKRHIKCDEQRPSCGDCQRLQTPCSLNDTPPSTAASPSVSSPSVSTPAPAPALTPTTPLTASSERPANPEDQVSMLDLELLYHYTNSTVQSFFTSDSKALLHLATHEYIEVALQHPFVMHTLLAVSALHMYSKDRSKTSLFAKATTLQGIALRGVHPYVSNLQIEHAIPAFIFSNFTGMFTFAELVLSAEPPQDAIEDMLSCFKILRGTATIVRPFTDYLVTTWLKPALTWGEYLAAVNIPAEQRVPTQDRILVLVQELDPAERQVVHWAVDRLFSFINLFIGTPISPSGAPSPFVQAWPVWVDQVVIDMCARRDPLALVILAHYAALMALRPEVWWMKGWPLQLLGAVEHALAGRLQDLLLWPREVVYRTI